MFDHVYEEATRCSKTSANSSSTSAKRTATTNLPTTSNMATTDSDQDTQSLTIVESVQDGLRSEMARDDDVIVLGEDVGQNGGVFRATDGLYEVR